MLRMTGYKKRFARACTRAREIISTAGFGAATLITVHQGTAPGYTCLEADGRAD